MGVVINGAHIKNILIVKMNKKLFLTPLKKVGSIATTQYPLIC